MQRAILSLCALGLTACFVSTAVADVEIQLPGHPALSPDGRRVAFSWQGDLWEARVRGGEARRLTFHPAVESRPVYSRDGEQIAFISNRTGSDQVFVMPAQGGEPRQVTAHSEGYQVHAWFPDGKSILTTGVRDHHWRDATRLIRVWVDGSRGEEVLIDAAAQSPSLSPDGTQILFVREGAQWWRKGYRGSTAAQVWLLDLESRETRQLINQEREALWPVWAHNGEGFYFAMGDAEGFDLWRGTLPEDTEQEVQIERVVDVDTHSVLFLAAAAEAPALVYRHGFDLYRWNGDSQTSPKQIKLRAVGDGLRSDDQIRRTLTWASEVAFHPDGLEIAMIAGGDVWVMDTTLREPVRVTDTPGYETSLVWGPKGDSLWFVSSNEGQADICRAERADTGTYWWRNREFRVEQITDDAAVESRLRFCPQGDRLLYVRGNGELWSRNMESGEVTKLVDGFSTPDYDVSPDGRWLAYSHEDDNFNSEVFLMPIDRSADPVNISQHPDNDSHPRFSLDGKMLAFTGRRFASETDIFYLYLEKQLDELTSRDRKLEKALEKLQEEREKKTSDNKKKEEKGETPPEDAKPAGVKVDFDQIEQRIRHLPLPNVDEHGLVWIGDDKLAFEGRIDGKRGFYTVTFPDERTPKLLTETTGGSVHWSPEAKAIFLAARGKPARIETNGRVTEYPFAAFQTLSRSERYAHGFDVAWQIMRDRYYDPRLGGKNWDQVRRRYRDAAAQSTDNQMFGEVIRLMLGELNGSHHGFYPEWDEHRFRGPSHPDRTPHLGLRFEPDYQGPGLKVRDVLPGGPTDRAEWDIAAGDQVVTIDGHKVDPSCDLATLLNGRMDRDILVEYQKPDADQTQTISVRPISYGQARSSLYNLWIDTRRKGVEKQSEGKLGYLHIRKMDQESFHEFERQLYAAGNGKQGLVIDVRDNGGGSTTDLLLTSLTQPRHAITVPRNGGPGYPHDRQVFATWHKPIIVLCNQNSFSNAEIFSHAIKTLKRGKLVGVPTAGGVISTGETRVIDLGRIRLPRRGWFLVETGEDMELHGAVPDEILWPKPGELPAGIDRQLERAVELLLQEVASLPDDPEPKYAADRKVQED